MGNSSPVCEHRGSSAATVKGKELEIFQRAAERIPRVLMPHPTSRGPSLSILALTSCIASIALHYMPFGSVSSIRLSASKGHLPGAGTT